MADLGMQVNEYLSVALTILLAGLRVGLRVGDICPQAVEDLKVPQRLAFVDVYKTSVRSACQRQRRIVLV